MQIFRQAPSGTGSRVREKAGRQRDRKIGGDSGTTAACQATQTGKETGRETGINSDSTKKKDRHKTEIPVGRQRNRQK